jgi:O-antigen/teichoic acid export membrane protein
VKLLKTEYFKNIFNQAIIVFVAQLIPVVFSPIITRLYSENAIAEITGLISITSILLVFSSLKLENAIVIEKEDTEAKNVIFLSIIWTFVYTLIILIIIQLFKEPIKEVFKVEKVLNIIPIYIFSFSILNILNFWFVRLKKFKLKAYSKLIETIVYIIFSVVLYYLIGNNEFGLAVGKTIGVIVALITLYCYSNLKLRVVSFKKLKTILVKHKEFPLYNAPSNFLNVIGLQLLVLFIGANFSKENFGYFGLANMIVLLPISLVSQSVGSIFFQKINENYRLKNYKQIKKVFFETLYMLLAIAIPTFIVLLFFSEEIFSIVFGENWIVSGMVAKRLSLVFLFQLVVSPLGITLIAINKVRINSYWQYGRFLFIAITMYILLKSLKVSFLEFVVYYSWGITFVYSVYFIIIVVQLGKLGK